MTRIYLFALLLSPLVLLGSCQVAPASADGGSGSCGVVQTFFRADVDGDGVMSFAESESSGVGDPLNEDGEACPFGWSYVGYVMTANNNIELPVCFKGD